MQPDDIYKKLIDRIKQYHPTSDYTLVEKAYEVAKEGHKYQVRKSGEPYIIHPLWVAYILADLELDLESVVSGILHDIIEDTKYSYEDIESMFGVEIADIVKGVTKLDNIEQDLKKDNSNELISETDDENQQIITKTKSIKVDLQAENYRKMFIAMAKDIRVILIKIADRLHNMRTIEHMLPKKQKKKSKETLDIYAPLAHRLGISKLRYELEDLSFKYLYPEEYNKLSQQISNKEEENQNIVDTIIEELDENLSKYNIDFSVDGRTKHLFSIFKKMKTQNKTLEQVFDIFAVRVIVNKQLDCYEVLGVVHEMYKPIPSRFKDYIGMPKPNMYQSIHTVVIGPEGEPVEIQIRTWEMHRTAEYGIAAHWKYKEGKGGDVNPDSEEAKLSWLRQMLDWQKDMSDNDFLEALKTDLDVFTDNVYCFTPKGEIISLVKGATPIDFAYTIHSELGHRMIGAKVNGVIVPFTYELCSGDRVSILDSQNAKGPSLDWLNIVKTNQAKSKIVKWFHKENREAHILKGKDSIEKEIKKRGYDLNDILIAKRKTFLLDKFGFKDWDSLCAAVGRGGLREGIIVTKLEDHFKNEQLKISPDEVHIQTRTHGKDSKLKKSVIKVKGINDLSVKFSKCCTPLPGDKIIGFITRGRGISIHRNDCLNILSLDDESKNRLIETEWTEPEVSIDGIRYDVDIKIIAENRIGIINEITTILKDEHISVTAINSKMKDGVITLNMGISITDKDELDRIIRKILTIGSVIKIVR